MADDRLRLGELLAALSLATDLGNGFPYEKCLRTTLLATRLGERLGLGGAELSDVWYTAILRYTGCTAFAHEMARELGDDIAAKSTFAPVDPAFPSDAMKAVLANAGKGSPPFQRLRTVARYMKSGNAMLAPMTAADCEAVARYSKRLAMSPGVVAALPQMFERWDGNGVPAGVSREEIALPMRLTHVAHFADVHLRVGGREGAKTAIRRGRAGWFDPTIADLFLEAADELLVEIQPESVFETALDAEPEPRRMIAESQLDELARAFADFVDLKSPFTLTHSSGVAELTERAATEMGLRPAEIAVVRRAALLHDLGNASVSSGIWDKAGPLGVAEWERVRTHAYHSERILNTSPLLAPLGSIVGMHHERLDGTGYHRGNRGDAQPRSVRLLAAAEVFHALTEPRPHRAAFAGEQAVGEIESMASAGLLDPDAVSAVCAAVGHPVSARQHWPSGLTSREVEVLRLIARGATQKRVAEALSISAATAHTHVIHIYEKIGASTRAGAALFAMENRLLD